MTDPFRMDVSARFGDQLREGPGGGAHPFEELLRVAPQPRRQSLTMASPDDGQGKGA
jgi:hypothetical protein